MARIFKRPDRDEHYIDLTDAHGRRHRVAGYTSERLTRELARRLEQLRDCRQSGIMPPADARAWLETQPPATVAKWADMGLVAPDMAALGCPLADLLDLFIDNMKAKGRDKQHVHQTRTHVSELMDDAKLAFWTDATPERIRAALDKYGQSVTNRTRNGRLVAFRAFAKWSVKNKRATFDPTADIEKLDEKGGVVYVRRPLSPEDLRRLIAAATRSTVVFRKMSGRTRAVIYLIAASTGWRWSEMKRLRRMDFYLDETPPMIAPPGWTQKSRREDRLPLRADVAETLRDYFADHPAKPDAPAFPMPPGNKGAQMLRFDLANTGDPADVAEAKRARGDTPLAPIPYEDERRRVADFHALRYALATMVSRSGATMKVAQGIMRHSDMALTLGYTDAEAAEHAAALEALPALLPAKESPVNAPETAEAAPEHTTPAPAAMAGESSNVGNRQTPSDGFSEVENREKGPKNGVFRVMDAQTSNRRAVGYSIVNRQGEGAGMGKEKRVQSPESGAISGAKLPGNHRYLSDNCVTENVDEEILIVDATPTNKPSSEEVGLQKVGIPYGTRTRVLRLRRRITDSDVLILQEVR